MVVSGPSGDSSSRRRPVRPIWSGTTRSMPSRRRSTSGHQRPAARWAERVGEDERVADRRDDARRAGVVEHAEVPVAPGRAPGLGVEDEVVVGQLDRTGTPAGDGLGDGDLELADRALLVVATHPRVDHRGERVGVVHEVRRVRTRRDSPRVDGTFERGAVRVGDVRDDVRGPPERARHRRAPAPRRARRRSSTSAASAGRRRRVDQSERERRAQLRVEREPVPTEVLGQERAERVVVAQRVRAARPRRPAPARAPGRSSAGASESCGPSPTNGMLQKSHVCIDGAPPGSCPGRRARSSEMSALPGCREFRSVIASEFWRRASSVPAHASCGARASSCTYTIAPSACSVASSHCDAPAAAPEQVVRQRQHEQRRVLGRYRSLTHPFRRRCARLRTRGRRRSDDPAGRRGHAVREVLDGGGTGDERVEQRLGDRSGQRRADRPAHRRREPARRAPPRRAGRRRRHRARAGQARGRRGRGGQRRGRRTGPARAPSAARRDRCRVRRTACWTRTAPDRPVGAAAPRGSRGCVRSTPRATPRSTPAQLVVQRGVRRRTSRPGRAPVSSPSRATTSPLTIVAT